MADEPEKVEEITVRVEDEGLKPEGTAPDASAADPVAELKAQYDELQAQQKQEQEARQASDIRARQAEERSRAAEEAARAARTEATDTRLSSIEQAIQAANSAAEAAKSEYTAALEAGDWKRAGEAQSKLSRAVAEGVQYEQNKAAWEQAVKAPPEPQRQQPQSEAERIEAWINQLSRTSPNSANWLRNHRDWMSDPEKSEILQWAHQDAKVRAKLRVDSPEYLAHVEKVIGLTKEEAPKTNGVDKPAARKTQSAPVAPVTSSPGGTSGGATEVRLTKGQAQVATDGTHVWNYDDPSGQKRFKKGDPIGIQEMARRVKALRDKGEFERENYEA